MTISTNWFGFRVTMILIFYTLNNPISCGRPNVCRRREHDDECIAARVLHGYSGRENWLHRACSSGKIGGFPAGHVTSVYFFSNPILTTRSHDHYRVLWCCFCFDYYIFSLKKNHTTKLANVLQPPPTAKLNSY